MRFFFFSIFFFISFFLFSQTGILTYVDSAMVSAWSDFNGVKKIKHKECSTESAWSKGMLNGNYKSHYKNGNLKSVGKYYNNSRVGKWKLLSENGKEKIVLNFKKNGKTKLCRAKIKGKGGVIAGYGKIYNKIPANSSNIAFNFDTSIFVKGTMRFSGGYRSGKEIEYYSNGNIRSETEFRKGLYNGKRTLYFINGRKNFEYYYKNGVPFGNRYEFSIDGDEIQAKSIKMANDKKRVLYIDKFDIYSSKRNFIYVDTSFKNTKLFFSPDSAETFFTALNKTFIDGNLSAYKDFNLQEVYFPKHDKADVSGLNREDGNAKNLRGFSLRTEDVFDTQTLLMYRIPIVMQPVSAYKDGDKMFWNGGPWLYFPQLKNYINNEKYNFAFLKSFMFSYASIDVYENLKDKNLDMYLQEIAARQINSVELEHDLWLIFYGIK